MRVQPFAVVGVLLAVLRVGPVSAASMESWGEQKNRFGLQSRIGFNLKARFEQLGGFSPRTDIGPAAGGVDHVYDDGYNLVDASGNYNGKTWNWGYDSARQFSSGTDSIEMSSMSARATGETDAVSGDPQFGAELIYQREIGWSSSYWWGVQVAVGWTDLSFRQSDTFLTDAVQVTDRYGLGGIVPPSAPYAGTFDGPGPLLSDTPTRTTATLASAATTQGTYELNADAYSLRVGLLFETPFADWLMLQFGGGVMGSWIDSEFSYRESTYVSSVGTYQSASHSSDDDFSVGAYAEVNLGISLSRRLSLVIGGQYLYAEDYEQDSGDRQARIQFENSIYLCAGVIFAF